MGNAASFGLTRQGAAHSSAQYSGTLGAGLTRVVGPLRSIGMQRAVLTLNQTTAGAGSVIASIEFRIKSTWIVRQANIAGIAGNPVTVEVLVPGARQVRAQIVAPAGGAVAVTATLGVLQGS